VASSIFDDVDLLSLDAGNTLVFLDHERVARVVATAAITGATLQQAEGHAKRLAESGGLIHVAFSGENAPGARSWAGMIATMLAQAGAASEALPAMLERLWRAHCEKNLWSLPPPGLLSALQNVKIAGIALAVVSNSEGRLRELLTNVGIADVFDRIIDSGVVGIEKPDPRVFALGRGDVAAAHVLHLGDVYATDIVGANAAGIRCALIDPYGHYVDRFPDIPRVDSVVEACQELVQRRQGSTSR
jgi:FMN phosphatase YigB (HAD superfamily)